MPYSGTPCPLCDNQQTGTVHQAPPSKARVSGRWFLHCPKCQLIFVPQAQHISQEEERKQYALHDNHYEDEGYRRFLNRLAAPLLDTLAENSRGLDFGCGPEPVLKRMMSEFGHDVKCFDPFFYPESVLFNHFYDFICATEVMEHVTQPRLVLETLKKALKNNENSVLALMTKRWTSFEAFYHWHYWRDPTHICFFHLDTFHYIANVLDMHLEVITKDVVFLRCK